MTKFGPECVSVCTMYLDLFCCVQAASWVTLVALGAKIILVSVRLRRYVTSMEKMEKMANNLENNSLLGTLLRTISEESDSDCSDDGQQRPLMIHVPAL